VDIVNFGHEPPLLVRPDGVRFLPLRDGLPLGLGELDPRTRRTATVRLAPDETLLLVTDGVTEARDGDGVFFPLREYLTRALVAGPPALDPAALVRLVRDGVLAHTGGGLDDDTTIFAVRRASEPMRRAPGTPR
jgi:serine phosphatase RsbU (regulator of sigma subunit)